MILTAHGGPWKSMLLHRLPELACAWLHGNEGLTSAASVMGGALSWGAGAQLGDQRRVWVSAWPLFMEAGSARNQDRQNRKLAIAGPWANRI